MPNIKSNKFWGKVEHGWWIGSIVTALSGFPFTPTLGSNRSWSGNLGGAPDFASRATAADAAACPVVSPSCPYVPIPFNPGTVITGNPQQWFNPAMFTLSPVTTTPGGAICTSGTCNATAPGFSTLGNVARGMLRGPGLVNWDFSLNKDTAVPCLGSEGKVQFRAEFVHVRCRPDASVLLCLGVPGNCADCQRQN